MEPGASNPHSALLLLTDLPPIPPTPIAHAVTDFALTSLPRLTFNHSMRAYHLGLANSKTNNDKKHYRR